MDHFSRNGSGLGLEGISIGALAGVYGKIDNCGVPVIAQIRTFFVRDLFSMYFGGFIASVQVCLLRNTLYLVSLHKLVLVDEWKQYHF